MKGLLARLGFAKSSTPDVNAPSLDALQPDSPFIAIGDIHGCLPQLETLLAKIETEHPGVDIICVGDFVDRGEQSAQVLRLLMERQQAQPETFFCLMGNHEEMMLSYLDKPDRSGDRWLRFGGLQTLASFRVQAPMGPQGSHAETSQKLREAMGDALEAWIRELPVQFQRGTVGVVHAGADPATPLDKQSRKTLLWGHPAFAAVPRADDMWVLHGHTIVDRPTAEAGRIAVDTGAYATGRLTAALVEPGQVRFLSA
jgi:serine/threonine protein phosphatase 1